MCFLDVDECTEDTDDCHSNASCTNVPGSFNCTCYSGFRGDGVENCTGKLEEHCSNGNSCALHPHTSMQA